MDKHQPVDPTCISVSYSMTSDSATLWPVPPGQWSSLAVSNSPSYPHFDTLKVRPCPMHKRASAMPDADEALRLMHVSKAIPVYLLRPS